MLSIHNKQPNKIAIQCSNINLNYHNLLIQVEAYRNYLQINNKNNFPIVLLGTKSINSVIIMLASVSAGIPFSVISQDWSSNYIQAALSLLKPQWIYIPNDGQKVNLNLLDTYNSIQHLPSMNNLPKLPFQPNEPSDDKMRHIYISHQARQIDQKLL